MQGLIEIGSVSEQDRTIHRMLTPILKLYTAKQVHFTHVCVLQGTVYIRLLNGLSYIIKIHRLLPFVPRVWRALEDRDIWKTLDYQLTYGMPRLMLVI